MKNIIAIGENWAETQAFSTQYGHRALRHVVNRDTIRGVRADEVHLLPGYARRRDRHAIEAEIKRMGRSNPRLETFNYVKIQSKIVCADLANDLDNPIEVVADAVVARGAEKIAAVQNSQLDILTMIAEGGPVVHEDVAATEVIEDHPMPVKKAPKPRKPAAKSQPKARTAAKPAPKSEKSDFFDFLDGE